MHRTLLLFLVLTAVLFAGCAVSEPTPTAPIVAASQTPTATAEPTTLTSTRPDLVVADVVRVVDGDTIVVEIAGEQHTVRYIGIDTPETVHPSRPVEEFGQEASDRNKELVEGRQILLEKDVSETDQFGRLLRYVWLDDVTMVNAVLVSEGLAQVSTFPPDVKHTAYFTQLQSEARGLGAGMWADVEPLPGNGECDPAYPDVCIPPFPPDLSCSDIPERGFTVLPPDPHRFDGNNDGIGCVG